MIEVLYIPWVIRTSPERNGKGQIAGMTMKMKK
jgi:hypothetical protein